MKKSVYKVNIKSVLAVMFACMLAFLCCFHQVMGIVNAGTVTSTDYIRVGLKKAFYGRSSIKINNKSVWIGLSYGNSYTETDKLISNSGFEITCDRTNFAILNGSFDSFDAALKKAKSVNSIYGLGVIPALTGLSKDKKGTWKLYIPYTSKTFAGNTVGVSRVKRTSVYMLKVKSDGGTFLCDCENARTNPQFAAGAKNDAGVGVISLAGSHFRGRIEAGTYGAAAVSAVNVIMFEDYLYGVVPMEMSSSWPMEALKAQAVACRSFSVASQGFGPSGSVKSYPTLNDTTQYQSYGGYDKESSRSNKAVYETRNTFVSYKNKVVRTYFYSTSGGATEAPEYLWGSKVAYLKSVPDIYENKPEKAPWTYEFSASKVASLVSGYGTNLGIVKRIDILKTSPSGRAVEMRISGTKGSVTLRKGQIRSAFGLPSTKVDVYNPGEDPDFVSAVNNTGNLSRCTLKGKTLISGKGAKTKISGSDQVAVTGKNNIKGYSLKTVKSGNFLFVGSGYGHGIGMSQSGARGMAEAGFGYKEILMHYFTGVEVN